MKANINSITTLARNGKGRATATAGMASRDLLDVKRTPSVVPTPSVTSAPMAFHQNQNTLGKNNQRMRLTPTPVAAATLAARGVTLGRVVSKNIPRMGP